MQYTFKQLVINHFNFRVCTQIVVIVCVNCMHKDHATQIYGK